MATPLSASQLIAAVQANSQAPTHEPRTVLAAKFVNLALVSYSDEQNRVTTQLAIVGDNKVQLLDMQKLGVSVERTPVGIASDWLADGIKNKLSPKAKAPVVKGKKGKK